MILRDHAFYRSTLVRATFIVSGGYLASLLSPWGPVALRNTPSLLWLDRVIPFDVLSVAFLVYTALLVWGSIEASVIADFLGLFLYLIEFIALCVTAPGHPNNGWVFCAFVLAIVFHIAAGRLALYEREAEHR